MSTWAPHVPVDIDQAIRDEWGRLAGPGTAELGLEPGDPPSW